MGLDEQLALMLGRGLGAGLGQGLVCGAVSGAAMVLGLAQGPAQGNDQEARYQCYAQFKDFARRFRERHGSLICQDLIGVDLGSAEGLRLARERQVFTTICPPVVKAAAEILQGMLPGL
jgi:C_GCAxxG_C_C family probable redox protein